MGISHLRSGGVDLPLEQTLGESLKLDQMINLVVALRYECKVGYADSDFDLSEKNVGHNLPHKVSVVCNGDGSLKWKIYRRVVSRTKV